MTVHERIDQLVLAGFLSLAMALFGYAVTGIELGVDHTPIAGLAIIGLSFFLLCRTFVAISRVARHPRCP